MAIHDESPYLYLTTIGRRSRLPREIEIWYTRRNERHYVISEQNDRAQWVRNILADPRVQWRVGNATFTGKARTVDPTTEPELAEAVQTRSRNKYGWGEGLIIELTPDRTDWPDGPPGPQAREKSKPRATRLAAATIQGNPIGRLFSRSERSETPNCQGSTKFSDLAQPKAAFLTATKRGSM